MSNKAIQDAMDELNADKHTKDREFIPDSDTENISTNSTTDNEEIKIIDELFAGFNRQGCFLKLSKEIKPGEFELKIKIDNFDNWVEAEVAVFDIVKYYTQKNPTKWGSGTYRITVCNKNGTRSKHRHYDFNIDAGEFDMTSQSQPASTMPSYNDLSSMIKTMREVNPTVSPEDMQKQNYNAFNKGIEIATNRDALVKNDSNAMMAAMMTMMGTVITAVLSNKPSVVPTADPTESLIKALTLFQSLQPKPIEAVSQLEQIKLFRELGLIKTSDDNDPLKKLSDVKELISLATSLTGLNRPEGSANPITDKIIEIAGQKAPELLGGIANIISAAKSSSQRTSVPQPIQPIQPIQTSSPQASSVIQPIQNKVVTENESMFGFMLNDIYDIINASDISKYDILLNKIRTFAKDDDNALIEMVCGNIPIENAIKAISDYGGSKWKTPEFTEKFVSYFKGFLQWFSQSRYITKCDKCDVKVIFNSIEDFNKEEDHECGMNECTGELKGIITVVTVGDI